jgi:hypothetical protein
MFSIEIAVLEQVSVWLCSGRLFIRDGDDGLDDATEHVALLAELRTCRRWNGVISMRLLASVHIGRSHWARRNLLISIRIRNNIVATHRVNDIAARNHITALVDHAHDTERQLADATEELAELRSDYENLRGRHLDMMNHAQELEFQLLELRAPREPGLMP